jgi:hypothetical protein
MRFYLFNAKVKTKYILADYQKWRGRFVHYSDFPELKINPKTWHRDPAAIYLFPENFRTKGSWHKKKYKFAVDVPDSLKVLDLSDIKTEEDARSLVKKLKVSPDKLDYFLEHDKPAKAAWSCLQQVFERKSGLFNKLLRQAGYDAVFDDTDSIFSDEVQLLVLDPTKIKAKLIPSTGSGYKEVIEIFDYIKDQGAKFGKVKADNPIKKFESWDKKNIIKAGISIISDKPEDVKEEYEKNYLSLKIIATPKQQLSNREKLVQYKHSTDPAAEIEVYLQYSNPDLKDRKFLYRKDLRDFNMEDVKKTIDDLFHHFFVELKK